MESVGHGETGARSRGDIKGRTPEIDPVAFRKPDSQDGGGTIEFRRQRVEGNPDFVVAGLPVVVAGLLTEPRSA